MFNITREQAIKLFLQATNQDDPYWADLVEDFYDESTDTMPTVYDILKPLGVHSKEVDEIDRTNMEDLI